MTFKKGHKGYWKGKKREPYSEETRLKQSLAHKNQTFSEEHKRNLSLANIGKHNSPVTEFKKGHTPYNKGKKRSEKTRGKISLANKGKIRLYSRGKLNPNWKGGIQYEPYPTTWKEDLKEVVRKRDNYLCQLCFKSQEEEGRKLCIHHIDYCKENVNIFNLISLCVSCHSKTNIHRAYWESYFNGQMIERGFIIMEEK